MFKRHLFQYESRDDIYGLFCHWSASLAINCRIFGSIVENNQLYTMNNRIRFERHIITIWSIHCCVVINLNRSRNASKNYFDAPEHSYGKQWLCLYFKLIVKAIFTQFLIFCNYKTGPLEYICSSWYTSGISVSRYLNRMFMNYKAIKDSIRILSMFLFGEVQKK